MGSLYKYQQYLVSISKYNTRACLFNFLEINHFFVLFPPTSPPEKSCRTRELPTN